MIAVDLTTRAGRMLSAGRVTVTFRSPTGQHITLTAKCRTLGEDGKWSSCRLADAKVIFIEVPNSQGWNDKVGKITRAKGFQPDPNADPARTWCATQLQKFVASLPLATGLEALEESACGRCGRALTDPVSIERGIGPECYGQMTGSQHEVKLTGKPRQEGGTGVKAEAPKTVYDLPIATWAHQLAAAQVRNATALYNAEYQAAEIALDQAAIEEHEAAQVRNATATDKQGVPLAVGDWKARKRYLQAARTEDKKVKVDKPSSQNRILEATGDAIPY